jgi:hypothetical protein
MGGLEASSGIALEYLLIVDTLIEVVPTHRLSLHLFVLVEELLHLLLDCLRRNYLRLAAHIVQQYNIDKLTVHSKLILFLTQFYIIYLNEALFLTLGH